MNDPNLRTQQMHNKNVLLQLDPVKQPTLKGLKPDGRSIRAHLPRRTMLMATQCNILTFKSSSYLTCRAGVPTSKTSSLALKKTCLSVHDRILFLTSNL